MKPSRLSRDNSEVSRAAATVGSSTSSRRPRVGQVRRVEEVIRRRNDVGGGTPPSHHSWLELSPSAESAATAATASTSTTLTASPPRRIITTGIDAFPTDEQRHQHNGSHLPPRDTALPLFPIKPFADFDDEAADEPSSLFPSELECPRLSRVSVSELAAFYEKVDDTKLATKRPEMLMDDEEAPNPFHSVLYEDEDDGDDRKPAAKDSISKKRWTKRSTTQRRSPLELGEMGQQPRVLPGAETLSLSSAQSPNTNAAQNQAFGGVPFGDDSFDQSDTTYTPSITSGPDPPSMQSGQDTSTTSGHAPPSMQRQVDGSPGGTEMRVRPPPPSMLPQPAEEQRDNNSPASTPQSSQRRRWSASLPMFHGVLEATLVTDVDQQPPPPVYDAVPVPKEEPLPWWKRNQKYLFVGLGCLVIGALAATVGLLMLAQGKSEDDNGDVVGNKSPSDEITPAPSPLDGTTTTTTSTIFSEVTEGHTATATPSQPVNVSTVTPIESTVEPNFPNSPSTTPDSVAPTKAESQPQPSTVPTTSPIQNTATDLDISACTNTAGFVDNWGAGCEYYESEYNRNACSLHGEEKGPTGMSPNEDCCICKTSFIPAIGPTTSQPTQKPSTPPAFKPTPIPTKAPSPKPTPGPTSSSISSQSPVSPQPVSTCSTQDDCNLKSQQLGFTKFQAGTYPTYGCFSKGGVAYFGVGGTNEEISEAPLAGQKERIWCNGGELINVSEPPTTSPSAQASINNYCISIQLQTDRNGDILTGFKLATAPDDGSVSTTLLDFPVESLESNQGYTEEKCVPRGSYELTIIGWAQYSANINGEEILFGHHRDHKSPISHIILAGYEPTLNGREREWLNQHNIRRESFHKEHNTEYRPLYWSHELAKAAANWAENRLETCVTAIEPNVDEGQNMSIDKSNRGRAVDEGHPAFVLNLWSDNKVDMDYPDNDTRTQVLWHSTRHVGCAEKSILHSDGSYCHVSVCRYSRPGNCNMKDYGSWLEGVLEDRTMCGRVCPKEGCY